MSVEHRDAPTWPLFSAFSSNNEDYLSSTEPTGYLRSYLDVGSRGHRKQVDAPMGYGTNSSDQVDLKDNSQGYLEPSSMFSDKCYSRETQESESTNPSTDADQDRFTCNGSISPPAKSTSDLFEDQLTDSRSNSHCLDFTASRNTPSNSSFSSRPPAEVAHNTKVQSLSEDPYRNPLRSAATPYLAGANFSVPDTMLFNQAPKTLTTLSYASMSTSLGTSPPHCAGFLPKSDSRLPSSSTAFPDIPSPNFCCNSPAHDRTTYARPQLTVQPNFIRSYCSPYHANVADPFPTHAPPSGGSIVTTFPGSNTFPTVRKSNYHIHHASPILNSHFGPHQLFTSSECYDGRPDFRQPESKRRCISGFSDLPSDGERLLNEYASHKTRQVAGQVERQNSRDFRSPGNLDGKCNHDDQLTAHVDSVTVKSALPRENANGSTRAPIPSWNNSTHPTAPLSAQPLSRSSGSEKRRGSQNSSRSSKRRRTCPDIGPKSRHQKLSQVSEVPTSLTIARLLSRNTAVQCISPPALEDPLGLYAPEPALTRKLACHKLTTNPQALQRDASSNTLLRNYGKKYSFLPFSLRAPADVSSDSLLSFVGLSAQEAETVSRGNFLDSAASLALARTEHSPLDPPVYSPRASYGLEPDHLHLYGPVCGITHRSDDDPLAMRYKRNLDPAVRSEKEEEPCTSNFPKNTHNLYSEVRQTVESLRSKPDCAAVCQFCAMQLFSTRINTGRGQAVFCSETCRAMYDSSTSRQQRLNKLSCIQAAPSNVYADNVISAVPILVHTPTPKLCKSVSKLSQVSKLNRRRPPLGRDFQPKTPTRRWQGARWMSYSSAEHSVAFSHVKANSAPQSLSTWLRPISFSSSVSSLNPPVADTRSCALCQKGGDADDQVAGRLLNYTRDHWIHVNCILWCYDTYETLDGCLMNVARSLKKAAEERCSHCNLPGAGLPCFDADCTLLCHLQCAHALGCTFHEDRSMFCQLHRSQAQANCLDSLAVSRRVFLSRDEYSLVEDVIGSQSPLTMGQRSKLRIGSLILHSIGQLLSEHVDSGQFHTKLFVYPVGFCTTRIYWSYRRPGRRCFYTCSIEDSSCTVSSSQDKWLTDGSCGNLQNTSRPVFTVLVTDPGLPDEKFRSFLCNTIWQHILQLVKSTRKTVRPTALNLFHKELVGEDLFGLSESHVVRAIESLPGIEHLRNYVFKFAKMQLISKMPLMLNPTGCARSEPKLRTYVRNLSGDIEVESHTTLPPTARSTSRLTYLHRCSQIPRTCYPLSFTAPIGKQSPQVPSKFYQYKRLRFEWKNNVLLARSKIQGLGLFAARDIDKHEFIIEYLGQLIRNEVGNLRERLYDSQNRGIYMFRADDDCIVDATMYGGLARYINHSCEPNCIAEVFAFEANKRIIIIAKRLIKKGEELTYDYKFDFEDDKPSRIPCLCGAKQCRKWMN
ncbi:Lysine Methyltransferase 2D [Sparganum proliferum]